MNKSIFEAADCSISRTDEGVVLRVRAPLTQPLLNSISDYISAVTTIWANWQADPGDITLLCEFPRLTALHVINRSERDLRPVESLQNLEILTLDSSKRWEIDFSSWPRLREFGGGWMPGFESVSLAKNLQILRVWRWKESDLRLLQRTKALAQLHLTSGALVTLHGLESCENLTRLSLSHFPRLVDISVLKCLKKLRVFSMDTCRKLRDISPVRACSELEVIELDDMGDIETLEPLRGLQLLRMVMLRGGTNVCDGNTQMLSDRGIQFAFQNRKHYNFRYNHITGERI